MIFILSITYILIGIFLAKSSFLAIFKNNKIKTNEDKAIINYNIIGAKFLNIALTVSNLFFWPFLTIALLITHINKNFKEDNYLDIIYPIYGIFNLIFKFFGLARYKTLNIKESKNEYKVKYYLNGKVKYYLNGKLHREEGMPAIYYVGDNNWINNKYYFEGKEIPRYNKEEFEKFKLTKYIDRF